VCTPDDSQVYVSEQASPSGGRMLTDGRQRSSDEATAAAELVVRDIEGAHLGTQPSVRRLNGRLRSLPSATSDC